MRSSPSLPFAAASSRKPFTSCLFIRFHNDMPRATPTTFISAYSTTPTPTPSSSVLLISSTNQLLLLHRIQSSQNFPSAHVFPGGNLDSFHDGDIPALTSHQRHIDGHSYRLGAIRETFEESGILLARNNGFGRLVEMDEAERMKGRSAVHERKTSFTTWLAGKGGWADVEGLIPFTRWITPISSQTKKRFTTQMYLYFLPLEGPRSAAVQDSTVKGAGASDPIAAQASEHETSIPPPTADGGKEHTSAQFLHAEKWLELARANDIIMFPPQFFLLTMVGRFLARRPDGKPPSVEDLKKQRQHLREFVRKGAWGERVISPQRMGTIGPRQMLRLHDPGDEELRRRGVKGVEEFVVLVEFKKEGPRNVDVRATGDVLDELGQLKSDERRASKM